MKRVKLLFALAFVLTLHSTIKAQDRHFAWTYESTTLPKGTIDIEPWMTFSTGGEAFHNKYENRFEFETGLTNRLQTAFYFNTKQETKATTNEEGEVTGLSKSSSLSFSNEWKLNLMNPSTQPFGLGLYGEYGLATDEIELEFKVILDKKLPKSTISYNLVGEVEFEFEPETEENGEIEIEAEKEYVLENNLAYMYMLKPNVGIGLEARNVNEFEEGEMEHSVLFAGPSLFYSQNNFFVIVNAQPQIANFKGGGIDLDKQRLSARILLGFSF